MPKIYAIRSFLYQSFKNTAFVAINHQVIHKICGRHFSILVCILPITIMGLFFIMPHIFSRHDMVSIAIAAH